MRGGAAVRDASGRVVGVVLASDHLSGESATHARQIIEAYQNRSQLHALRRPISGVYLTLFVMMTLMILVSATWTGLYLAKRITRPVQRLAAGAREIGAGHLDHRIEPETRDEFGSLVEAFNTMAGELAASQRKLEHSRLDLERKNQQLDERRQYIETVLERIATGVVSLGPDGQIETINGAALRLLEVDRSVIGARAEEVCQREDLKPLETLLKQTRTARPAPAVQEVALLRDGRELHLAAAATTLLRDDGSAGGAVLVFDDVTPLIRTQRVAAWRDVARRLAHEIKNPLTPIQLCAERMRRQFASAPAPARALVEECTSTIVGEVESLKALVDEFAQFARMPAPRAAPTDLNAALAETLALYNDLFREIRDRAALLAGAAAGARRPRADAPRRHQPRRQRRRGARRQRGEPRPNGDAPAIVVETRHDPGNGVARILVSDNGPGISAADRDKLFMPYYSTKRRGQRPRPRDRAPHHRRARRQHRSRRQCSERHRLHDRAADVSLRPITHRVDQVVRRGVCSNCELGCVSQANRRSGDQETLLENQVTPDLLTSCSRSSSRLATSCGRRRSVSPKSGHVESVRQLS